MAKIKRNREIHIIKKASTDLYTERKELNELFFSKLEKLKNDKSKELDSDITIINTYGIGGIGKTEEKNHLCDLLDKIKEEDSKNETKYICIDFKDKCATVRSFIIQVLHKLIKNYKIEGFPRTLFAIYKQCVDEGKPFEFPEVQRPSDKLLNGKPYQSIMTIFSLSPIGAPLGLLEKLINLFRKKPEELTYADVLSETQAFAKQINANCEEYIEIINKTPGSKIEERLVEFFYIDFNDFMKNEKNPFVFFLDTYENQIDTLNADFDTLPVDEVWIYDLMNNLNDVLWVISGREPLSASKSKKWDTLEPIYKEIECFSDKEIDEYMQKAEIDLSLKDTFSQISGGIPFFLEILYMQYVDLYNKNTGENEYLKKESYGANKEEVLERYVKYMNDSERALLKQLSVIDGEWTDEIVESISNVLEKYDKDTYARLVTNSIIKETDDGKYIIPKQIRTILLSKLDDCKKTEIKRALTLFYKENCEKNGLFVSSEDLFRYLELSEMVDDTSKDFFFYELEELIREYRFEESLKLLNACEKKQEMLNDNVFKSKLLYQWSNYFLFIGRIEESLIKAKECYDFSHDVLGATHSDTLLAMDNLANHLSICGKNNEALKMAEDCYSIRCHTLTEDNIYRITSMRTIAFFLSCLFKYKEALDKDVDCYNLLKNQFGKNDYNTLISLSRIAKDLSDLGLYNDALKTDEECYPLMCNVLGERHIDTLRTQHNIAKDLSKLGLYNKALNTDEKCYNLMLATLPENHPDTLHSLNHIAIDLLNLGQYKEALNKAEDCYRLRTELLGNKHPDSLGSLSTISTCLFYLGEYKESHEKVDECYKIMCEVLGEKHPATLEELQQIGICLTKMGKNNEALKLLEECYNLKCEVLGETHPKTIWTLDEIATNQCILGKYSEALKTENKCYNQISEALPKKHPDIIEVLYHISVILSYLGKNLEALNKAEDCYNIACSVLTEKHPNTLRYLNCIADVLCKLGRYKEALKKAEDCYHLRTELLGNKHPDSLDSLSTISTCLSGMGEYKESLKKSEECYHLLCELFGEKHPKTIEALQQIGMCLSNTGEHDKAINKDKECYKLRCEVLGEKHPDTLLSMRFIGADYSYKGDRIEAYNITDKCYNLYKEVLGNNHPETLKTLRNLAKVFSDFPSCEFIASEKYRECYRLQKEILGDKHPDTLTTLGDLAVCLSNMNSDASKEALGKCEECYKLMKEVLGEKHPDTLSTLKNLATILHENGEQNKSIERFEEHYLLIKEKLGDKHPDTFSTLLYLANFLFEICEYKKALEKFEEYYILQSNSFGKDSSQAKLALKMIVRCLKDIGWREDTLGDISGDTLSSSLNIIGICLLEAKQPSKALNKLEECYNIQKETLGENHIYAVTTLRNIACCFMDLGRTKEGLKKYKEYCILYLDKRGELSTSSLSFYVNRFAYSYNVDPKEIEKDNSQKPKKVVVIRKRKED